MTNTDPIATCPRCGGRFTLADRFYGPCVACRAELDTWAKALAREQAMRRNAKDVAIKTAGGFADT